MSESVWAVILEQLRASIDPDEYRRWFASSSQASDSGDQITIWVTSTADVRHITLHYLDHIYRELEKIERFNVSVRFVAAGYEDDEDDLEE
jgi:hypothetical protein